MALARRLAIDTSECWCIFANTASGAALAMPSSFKRFFLVYRQEMARGWESKSVEAQQDAAADRGSKVAKIGAEESARLAERATLSLARTRALADLQMACAPAHRSMLEQAILDLDRRIAALDRR